MEAKRGEPAATILPAANVSPNLLDNESIRRYLRDHIGNNKSCIVCRHKVLTIRSRRNLLIEVTDPIGDA